MTRDIEEVVDEWITNPDPAIVKKFDPVKSFRRVGTKATSQESSSFMKAYMMKWPLKQYAPGYTT